jgi:hypothetical protein
MNTNTDTAAMLAATVDQLAYIKAKLSALKAQEDELKSILAAAGPDIIEGAEHRAAVSITARTAIDWQAIAQHLKPSRQLITAHTKEGAPFAVVRISAKKTS